MHFLQQWKDGKQGTIQALKVFELQDKETKKVLENLSVTFVNEKLSTLSQNITKVKHTRASKKATAKTKMQGE